MRDTRVVLRRLSLRGFLWTIAISSPLSESDSEMRMESESDSVSSICFSSA